MVCRPALQFNLLSILKADLAIDHVRGGVISGVAVTKPALRAGVVPKLNFRLFGKHFHRPRLQGWPANDAEREPSIYGIGLESAKQDVQGRIIRAEACVG